MKSTLFIFFNTILILILNYSAVSGETYNRNIYKPTEKFNYNTVQQMVDKIRSTGHEVRTGHPRIFIKKETISELRIKIASNYLETYQKAVNLAYENLHSDTTTTKGRIKEPISQPIVLACGLIFQLGEIPGIDYHGKTIEEYGRAGISHLISLADLPEKRNYTHVEYLGLPLGYDWLYEIMSEGDRKHVGKRLLKDAEPSSKSVDSWNHPPGGRLLAALAVHGDGLNDRKANKLIKLFHGGMVFGEPKNVKPILEHGHNLTYHHIFFPEGPGKEGYIYSQRYHPFYAFIEAWYDQTGEDYYQLPFFQNWVFHATHYCGNEFEHTESEQFLKKRRWLQSIGKDVVPWLEIGLARSNPKAASLAKYNLIQPMRMSVSLIYMLRSNPSVKAMSPETLNLSKTAHFKIVNNIFMRNSWTGTQTTMAFFQSPVWGTHIRDLGPVNNFTLWKNGGFLLTKRLQTHDYDGGSRVNTFVLYDQKKPGETFFQYNVMDRAWNRGRLGRIEKRDSLSKVTKNNIQYTAGLRFYEHRPGEVTYMLGDGAKSFADERLSNWSRQFIWFRSEMNEEDEVDHFVVFDRLTKRKPTIKVHMMLNFNKKPIISDRTGRVLGSGEGVSKGIWKYTNGKQIIAYNDVKTGWGKADGKVFVSTLLPKKNIYYRMGGIGTRNIDLFGKLRQEKLPKNLINGKPEDPRNILAGMWRVQIASITDDLDQLFLHSIQATGGKIGSADKVQLIEGEQVVGLMTGKNMALFNRSGESGIQKDVTVRIPEQASGEYNILLADLIPNTKRLISIGHKKFEEKVSAAGIIFLKDIVLTGCEQLHISR